MAPPSVASHLQFAWTPTPARRSVESRWRRNHVSDLAALARPCRLSHGSSPFKLCASSASPSDNGSTPQPSLELPSVSAIEKMIEANRVLKSHISKMAVIELRNECHLAGLSSDGLKADLVERLLTWATARAEERHPKASTSSSTSSGPAGSNAPTPKPAKSIMPIIDTPQDIRVQWLGTSSGAPTGRRNVSCIAVRYGTDRIFLVDCGEGTRNQIRTGALDPALVTHIFITHLHGDHCFGIPGTIAAIAAARLGTPLENQPIEVHGPPELHKLMVSACKSAGMQLSVPVIVKSWVFDPEKESPPTAVDPAGKLLLGYQPADQAGILPPDVARAWQAAYEGGSDQVVRRGLTWTTKLPGGVTVTAAQLQHRMPCWGYVFEEPTVPAKTPKDPRQWKQWGDEVGEGEAWVQPGRKMVILGDTCDSTAILELAKGCDILSHEATFQKGMEEKARIATHSTSEQAGAFAKQCRAKYLVLTHFSGRYEQSDKYNKVWIEAKQKGKTMKEMHFSNFQPLAEEAKAAAGSTRVLLANDFFNFKVAATPEPVPEKIYLESKKRQQHNLAQQLAQQQGQGYEELQLAIDIPIAVQSVAVGEQSLPIIVADCDAVMQMYIDAGQGDRDPYWTCLWPSSILMAQELLRRPELVAGKRVADLGCGLGLGGVAAALAGAEEVVFLDREPLALQCSLLNAVLCGQSAALDPETAAVAAALAAKADSNDPAYLIQRLCDASKNQSSTNTPARVRAEVFDWSYPLSSLLGYFDVVLACDVLYEVFSVEPVASVAPLLLKPRASGGGGGVFLADPPLRAKQNRERFLELIGTKGYVAAEWGQRAAQVWEESEKAYREVPIEFMILQQGCVGDTIGVKFYKD